MSYHAGVGGGMRRFGLEPCEPHIVCDDCGRTRTVYANKQSYQPGAWFLDGKKAPGGWTGGRTKDGLRREDYCPECSEKRRGR